MAMLVPGLVAPLAQIGRDLDPSFNVMVTTQPHTYRPTQPLPSAKLLKGEVLAPHQQQQQHTGPFTGPTRKSSSHQFTHNNNNNSNTEFTTTPRQRAQGSHDDHKTRTLRYSKTAMLPSQHHTDNNTTRISWTPGVAPSF